MRGKTIFRAMSHPIICSIDWNLKYRIFNTHIETIQPFLSEYQDHLLNISARLIQI